MRRYLPELITAFGGSIFAGGLVTFLYGFYSRRSFMDFWGVLTTPQNLCLFGGIMIAVGIGALIFGLLMLRVRLNKDEV